MESIEDKDAHVLREEIEVVPYDSRWQILFEQERLHLMSCLPNGLIRRIEHFGSTAIAGMSAKPIVDMLVEVSDLEKTRKQIAPILVAQGYEYFSRASWGESKPPFHAWFIKRDKQGNRTHHIHMVESDPEHWERILFRDYLIEYHDVAKEYSELKEKLSMIHRNDRVAYTNAKAAFIKKITEKAKRYYEQT